MSTTTAAAILAGGRARRLGGRDKSRLVVAGESIIVRQVEVLQAVADPVLIIGRDPVRFADLGLAVHDDLVEGAGAMGGVYTALEVAGTAAVLVVACDLPFLDADVLRELRRLAEHADAAWIRTARGAEPLLACYQRAVRHRLRQAIDDRRYKLADLADDLRIAELGTNALARFGAPDRLLTNINTPDDYARIQ